MKKLGLITLLFLIFSCNSENANDCLQTAGDIVQQEIAVSAFTGIVVNKKIELIVTQGPQQKVIIETGKNLLPDVVAEVIDNELILTNYNTCNIFRNYGITKVYVTSPNLTAIRNASEQNVSSIGVLTYPSLYLRSSGEGSNYLSVGDWHLHIENESVRIWSNGIATFYLDGTTTQLDINFSDGDTRFEGKTFLANTINVRNVSSNDMLIYPIDVLSGSIHSTGNVISYHTPPVVDVDVQNIGQLIFMQ